MLIEYLYMLLVLDALHYFIKTFWKQMDILGVVSSLPLEIRAPAQHYSFKSVAARRGGS